MNRTKAAEEARRLRQLIDLLYSKPPAEVAAAMIVDAIDSVLGRVR